MNLNERKLQPEYSYSKNVVHVEVGRYYTKIIAGVWNVIYKNGFVAILCLQSLEYQTLFRDGITRYCLIYIKIANVFIVADDSKTHGHSDEYNIIDATKY